jgi:hypothetical protein
VTHEPFLHRDPGPVASPDAHGHDPGRAARQPVLRFSVNAVAPNVAKGANDLAIGATVYRCARAGPPPRFQFTIRPA